MSQIEIIRLNHGKELTPPLYATHGSAGADLCSSINITIQPSEYAAIPTGFAVSLPRGFEAQIRPRSGNALKYGVTILNSPGTIDSDYRGEIIVILINLGKKPCLIKRGHKIAQMVISPIIQVEFLEKNKFTSPDTERGQNGFGYTGGNINSK